MAAKNPREREGVLGTAKGGMRPVAVAETVFWCALVVGALLLAAWTRLPGGQSERLARIGLRHSGFFFLAVGLIGQVAAAIALALLADRALKLGGAAKAVRDLAAIGVFISLCGLIASILVFRRGKEASGRVKRAA